MQSLNVNLGDLLGKESYYHVHLTLVEYQPGDRRDTSYTISQRIEHGFVWAIAWTFAAAIVAGIAFGAGFSVWVLRQKSESLAPPALK